MLTSHNVTAEIDAYHSIRVLLVRVDSFTSFTICERMVLIVSCGLIYSQPYILKTHGSEDATL